MVHQHVDLLKTEHFVMNMWSLSAVKKIKTILKIWGPLKTGYFLQLIKLHSCRKANISLSMKETFSNNVQFCHAHILETLYLARFSKPGYWIGVCCCLVKQAASTFMFPLNNFSLLGPRMTKLSIWEAYTYFRTKVWTVYRGAGTRVKVTVTITRKNSIFNNWS